MFVCMFVHSRISKDDVSKLHEIFCTCYLWPWLGPALTTDSPISYVLPVLWMTSCLHIIGEAKAAALIGRILKLTQHGAVPMAKSDVCDSLVEK